MSIGLNVIALVTGCHAGGKTATETTTVGHTVEAPTPRARPADPLPADPRVRFNVDLLNTYRVKAGVPPLQYDATLSAFAREGSKELAHTHAPHGHFRAAIAAGGRLPGFGSRSAENQGDPSGVPPMAPERTASGKKQIALLLDLMFQEGPGGGHHDNMLDPRYRRVGIGLHDAGGRLYLTNDFSD